MNFGDLHPFFTHFPIAFICLIAIIEILRLFTNKIPPFISLIILLISTLISFLAVQSGEFQKNIIQDSKQLKLIENHENFGDIVMWYSIVLCLIWLVLFFKKYDNKILKIFLILILVGLVVQTAFLGGELIRTHHIYLYD